MSSVRRILFALLTLIGAFAILIGLAAWIVDLDAFGDRVRRLVVDDLSARLGRPVTLARVSTKIFPRLGVDAEGLSIPGARPTDPPVLEARALGVRVSLVDVLRSLGKDIRVDEVVLVRPSLQLRRKSDGTVADAELLDRLRGPGATGTPPDPAMVERIERARIDRVAVERGRLIFVDDAVPGGALLELSPIGLEVSDVGLGLAPHGKLEVGLEGQRTLAARVVMKTLPRSYPLPAAPVLAALDVNLDAFPLSTLRPWLGVLPPALAEALVSADLDARSTGAAHYAVHGGAKASNRGSVLADITLDGDVGARGGGLAVAAELAIASVDLATSNLTARGAARGHLTAEGAPAGGKFDARLDLTGLALSSPGQLEKPAGHTAILSAAGEGRAGAARVHTFELELPPLDVRGSGALTGKDATVTFETNAIDLAALAGLVPSIPASAKGAVVKLAGRASGSTADPSAGRVTIDALDLRAGRTEIEGKAQLGNLARPNVTFDLTSPMLDADALLAEQPDAKRTPAGPDPLQKVTARGTLHADRGVLRGAAFQDLDLALSMARGRVSFERLGASAYGGRVDAGGTSIDLGTKAVDLALQLQSVKAEGLLGQLTSLGQTLAGTLEGKIAASFAGTSWDAITRSLAGNVELVLTRGRLSGFDLARLTARPLLDALPFARGLAAPQDTKSASTEIDHLAASFAVKDGLVKLTKSIQLATPEGMATLGGIVHLDQTLDLTGSFAFAPSALTLLTRGALKLDRPVPVGVKIGCKLASPCLQGVDVTGAVQALTTAYAKRAVQAPLEAQRAEAEKRASQELEARRKKLEEEAKAKARQFLGL